MSRLDEIQKRYANTPTFGQGSTLTPAQMTYKATDPAVVEEQKKQSQSKGFARFGEGVGYFFEKVGLGALRGIEGIVDFTAGGIADLFGADAWAERRVANDWVNYDHADEWYQPRNGFERFMGDLGGGIGSTLPALAAVALGAAITYVTGGAGAGAGAAVAGAGTAGLSTAMSMLISGATTLYSSGGIALAEAYKETGELTGKEWGYAALSGGTEGAIEAISAGIGVGTGKLIKQFSKSGSKVVASGLKKTALNLGKDFISEGAEEAAMEYIQPKFKQLTYDPNAKDATAQQIIYSGIVGGVSGMLMDGANVVVSKATDSVTGTLISKDQSKVDSVLAAAKSYADMEAKKPTKSEIIPEIAKQLEKYNALGDGAINNAKKTAILGSLSRLELLAETDKMAVGETMSILSNAESFAKTFKDGKYITPEGKEITVTKEALTNGIDLKDGKPTLDSIRKAIKNNFTLRAIVAARVSGEILANAGAMYTEVMEGSKTFQSDDEYRQFVEGLSDEQAESVMKQTGIDTMSDNAVTANAKLYYWKSEGNGKFIPKFNKAKNAEIRSKTLPQNPASVKVKKGELARYNDGFFDIVIEHNEDGTYNIFDINGGSGKLNATRKELNGYINSYRQAMVEVASAPTEMVEEVKKTREAKQTEESAERARLRKEATETVSRISERVEAYNGLSEPNKRAVREMARKAVSLGIKEDVILSSATYMANTGLNIQFVRPEAFDRPNVNALLKGDTIYINTGEVEISKAKTFDQLIIHETSHVLYRNAKVRKAIDKLAKRLTEEQRKQIEADYAEIVESKSKTEKQQIMDDEFGAHYLEYLLGKDGMLDALFSEEPTLRDKLEAHINKTEIAYKADHNLDRASKRVFKLFKKALADFSESNRGYNAYNVAPTDTLGIDDGRYNLAATDMHKKKLAEAFNAKEATVSLDELNKRYDKIITAWKEIGLELNSSFLEEWNSKKGKDAAYTLFKEQSGYKYNIELSTMCKKGLSLFEAIDTIVRKELTKQLDSTVITKADKEILYDILKSKGYDIPCAICYVEQARQREGVIIDAFVNGNKDGKLGWNSTIADIEQRMAAKGVSYKFPAADRAIATDEYSPGKSVKLMTEAEQKAYYDALLEITNEEVARYNKKAKKSRDMLKNTNAATVRSYFKGSLPSNLKLLKILFLNPESRFTIESDLLYSSHTARNLATFNTELYSLFNAQSGVAGYKLKQSPIIYWAEILDKQWAPSTLRKSGAIRNQSNSDLQMYTLLDQVQMYIDLTAKGYYLHAYTKVVSELKLLGLSNAKINASLIPQVKVYYKADGTVDIEKTKLNAGLDADGNLLFDDFEGINHKEAFMLLANKDYSKSLCGICIGYSDKHILKLLDEPRVQLIIGYHDKTNDMEKRYKGARYAKNYNGQNEAYDTVNKETKHLGFSKFLAEAEKLFKRDKATENFSGETVYNGKTYTADDIPRLAAKMYIDECKAKGYIPAYGGRGQGNYDFTTHENYYKLLGDFGLYDSEGHYAPLKKVAYNMPDTVPILQPDGSVTRMDTKEYIKKELRGELEVRDRLAQDLADTSKDGILQQFVSAKNAQSIQPKISTEDGRASVSQRLDADYIAAVKKGDMVTAQRMVDEAAREAGYTYKGYHGTRNGGFTVFKNRLPGMIEGLKSIFLAKDEGTAGQYAYGGNRKVYSLYAKMDNPLVVDCGHSEATSIFTGNKPEIRELARKYLRDVWETFSPTDNLTTDQIGYLALRSGKYDGVIFKNVNDSYTNRRVTDVYEVFEPEQIKSADPITYDDNGNIIPLSQRFNSANPDIRYSVTAPGGGAMGAPSFVDPARRSATLQSSGYKPTFGESFKDGAVATKIAATNAQAGLERLMREVGYTREEAETDVQFARLARAQASNVIGVKFTDISGNADGYEVLGDSLVETLAPVMPSKFTKDGSTAEEQRYTDFQMLQYHMLNVDRMSLEAKAKKRYLPLDAVRQRLALESEGIKAKIDAIRGIRAKIEENKTQLAREKKKTFPDKDRITELTDRIAELEKNADKIIKGAIKRYTAKNVDTMFTMDEAMLKDIAKEAKLTEEEIKSLIGNAVAVLTAEDIDALNGLSSIADPIGMLKVVRRIIDRHASNLGTQINTLMQIKNKPVLGKTVVRKNIDPETKEETKVETVEPMTAEESRKLIKRYEDKYKSDEGFNKALKGVRTYLDNLMRLRIDTGLVSADMAASLGDMYPNYVPAHRLDPASGLMVLKGSRLVEVNKTVSTAKGSIKQIKPLHENLIEQTESTVRAARLNQLMSKLYERFEASNNTNKEKHFKVVEKKPLTKGDPVTADELYNVDYTSPEKAPRENQITFFYNGEKITVEVSKDVFVGFNDLAGRRGDGLLGGGNFFGARVLEGSMKAFRAVTTNYNPFFIIRNLLKDLGDALLLSDVPFYSFGANYVGAIKQMAKNSEAWRLYVANGGLGNTFFDSKLKLDLKTSQRGFHIDSATKNPLSWIKTIGSAVEVGNQFVEQIPRFAAFLAARKGGATVAEAMNAAAEITTNFQRGGTVTKTFNRSLIPFLNASVQGFVKIPRRLFNLHGKTWRETLEKLAVLLTNCVIVGIVPLVINALICGDQEGYDELRNTDKENYFLIPTGDGKFIKIPRGRVQASLASISNLVTGGSTVKETWGNVSSQVSPWGTMTRTIFSPIKDVSTNTTWYGGEIEGQQFEGIRPGARYDEGTSWIAKTIGGVLDYSPKKIDYLLGQYTGFFGDVILDATSQKANGNPLVTNFSVDSVTSNKLSTEFYKYYNEAQYAKNEGDDTALYQLKYLNKVKKEIRELYDQKSAIQTNSELSDKEKLEQTRVIQSYINGLYSAAIDNFSKVTDSAVATSGFGLEENERFREVIRQSFGAEAALEHWDEKLYESAKQMQTAGVSFEDYYDFYFSTSKIESDKDKNGNTVSGSKRAKVLEIVKAMDIPTEQKMLLFTSRGYSIKSRDFSNYSENTARNRLLKYILSLNVSKDEKARIAEMCGFKVKNGKIIRE